MIFLDDDKNLSEKAERNFIKSQMFLIPLYAYEIGQTIYWIYCMALLSDGAYQPTHWIFDQKPEGWLQYAFFGFQVTFFGSLSSLAGHELVHHKNFIHKMAGNWPYTQFLYSHFWTEHTQGHHKYLATPLDPVCHDKGVDIYTGIVKAVVGTHVTSWDREIERLTRLNHDKAPSALHKIIYNKMVGYFVFHVAMLYTIFHFFGYSGLYF